jgi:hypothetical protein
MLQKSPPSFSANQSPGQGPTQPCRTFCRRVTLDSVAALRACKLMRPPCCATPPILAHINAKETAPLCHKTIGWFLEVMHNSKIDAPKGETTGSIAIIQSKDLGFPWRVSKGARIFTSMMPSRMYKTSPSSAPANGRNQGFTRICYTRTSFSSLFIGRATLEPLPQPRPPPHRIS